MYLDQVWAKSPKKKQSEGVRFFC